MTAKNYLKQANILELKITTIATKIEKLRDISNNISRIYNDDITGNANTNKIENIICSIVQLEYELKNIITQYIQKIKEIQEKINYIKNDTYKNILRLKYIDNLSMENISELLNYTERHLYRLEKNALKELELILKKYNVSECQ